MNDLVIDLRLLYDGEYQLVGGGGGSQYSLRVLCTNYIVCVPITVDTYLSDDSLFHLFGAQNLRDVTSHD